MSLMCALEMCALDLSIIQGYTFMLSVTNNLFSQQDIYFCYFLFHSL